MYMASSSTSPTSTPHHRSRFGDTTWTKVFVGGLAWETPTEKLRRYFEQFGDILEAVIISDKNTGRSKGYGFVTFREAEAAMRSVAEPNPVIDGRRANCNIAAFGRPRPSPPRGRNQAGRIYQGPPQPLGPPQYGRVPAQVPPPLIYPTHFGYLTYPNEYGYQQAAAYNHAQMTPHYYQQMYGPSSPSNMVGPAAPPPPPYLYPHYGYPTMQAADPSPRAQGPRPALLQYPTPPASHLLEGTFLPTSSQPLLPFQLQQPPHHVRRQQQQPLDTTTSELPTSQEPSTSGANVLKPESSEG